MEPCWIAAEFPFETAEALYFRAEDSGELTLDILLGHGNSPFGVP